MGGYAKRSAVDAEPVFEKSGGSISKTDNLSDSF